MIQLFRKILLIVKENLLFSFVMLLMLIGRIAISGQGFLDDSDEVDYHCSEDAFDALIHFDISGFGYQIANQEGKPAETFLKVFLVPLHRLWAWSINVPLHSPTGFWFWGLVNISVSMILLYVFYLILRRLNFDKTISVLGMAILGTFVNFNLYTRHLLPYDISLLFQLIGLYFLLSDISSNLKKYSLAGLFCALGFTSHYGCFMFVAITFGFVVLKHQKIDRQLWYKAKTFFVPFFLIILFFEVIYWIGGESYIMKAVVRSDTMRQGSYSEGFQYAWVYLSTVEGILGLCILPLFGIGFLGALKNRMRSDSDKLLLLATIGYFSFAFMIFFLEKFVFYGRVLHMYFPFMVLGVLTVLQKIKFIRSKYVTYLLLTAISIQYFFNVKSMNSFTYPRKVIANFGLSDISNPNVHLNFYTELNYSEDYRNNSRFIQYSQQASLLPKGNYDVVNTCFFHHFPNEFMLFYCPYSKGNGVVVFSKLHFMSYPPYLFEYTTKEGREFYIDKQFKIQIIKHT